MMKMTQKEPNKIKKTHENIKHKIILPKKCAIFAGKFHK